jgi:PAS domain S-box-containing protein
MREWFHRLKVSQKLMLISIFFVMPDSVMLYLFITGINANIQFARMEQKGNEYQRPLEALLELIPQHRHLAQFIQPADPESLAQVAEKQAQIEAAFDELETVDARIGADLQFTDEGLAKRKREHYRVQTVRGEWRDLKEHLAEIKPEDCSARHLHLVADLRMMITHAGDLSNLILDPDLDSYYLMDATLLALPQAQDRLAAVMAHGETVLGQPAISSQERQQFAIYAQLLKESDLDRIVGSVQTALNEDRNFYGTSATLQERVPPVLKDYLTAAGAFIEMTARLVDVEKTDVLAEEYFMVGRAARDASFKLWTVADAEVDILLQKRIEAYQARRLKSLLVAACALLAAIGFVTFITRSISGPLRQQAAELQTALETLQAEIAERNRAEAELRRSEAQLAAAQKIARIGSWEWDIVANKMNWSEENFRIHGFEPREIEASYDVALAFVRAEERGLSDTAFRKALQEKKPFSFVQHIIRRDGQERIIHQRGNVVLGADGKVAKMFGTAQDITERKRAEEELEKMHANLLEVSRQAGMAEVATGVLHNVGNVLNSVNVSALLISERLSKSRVAHLSNVSALIRENASDLAGFFTVHPKGKALPGFINTLAERLGVEQAELLREVDGLARNIAHIKDIVAVQQDYAKVSGVIESLPAEGLVEDALEMNGAAFTRHRVEVVREFAPVPPVRVDKHKVLQILINLIRNAKYAVSESRQEEKRVTVRVVAAGGDRVRVEVADNGIGIAKENLARIFAHGFTTKKDGHGFGLHSSALAAKEIGGSLIAQSDGPGRGATFTLELPVDLEAANEPSEL